jgi:5-methylcytosine-specific restriction endonuclease McrA
MTSDARRDADRLAQLLRTEHHARADFLLALADFDRRRGWAALGHAGLWAFLHHDLGLSAGAAFQRKEAVALLRRIPAVEAPLRDGRLCLSSVAELAKVLTQENQAGVLPRFFGKSAREAREVVAAIAPRKVVPLRTVVTTAALVMPDGPDPRAARAASARPEGASLLTSETEMTQPGRGSSIAAGTAVPDATPASTSAPVLYQPPASGPTPSPAPTSTPSPTPSPTPTATLPPTATAPPTVPPARATVEPLTAELRRLHLTVSRRFLQKLEAVRMARSHARPGATVEVLLEEALDLLLARETKRRSATTDRPRAMACGASEEAITARVRREVWARDDGRCQWPLEAGGVCGSTWQVEIDHVTPRGRGGPPSPGNLRLLCHAHNAEAARRAYGADFIASARRRTGRDRTRPGGGAQAPPE